MKKEDVNRIYSIPFSILDDYESLHLTKQEEYDEEDIEKLSFILSLQKLHFAHEDIKIYMQLYLLGDQTKLQRIKILKNEKCPLKDLEYGDRKSVV